MSRRKKPAIPNELLDRLLAGGAASAAFEQGGLLDSLKKALTEHALNAEMDHHLSGEDGAGNTRNGYGRKTVKTETGKLPIDVPRDRQASFDPQLIARYRRRFPGFDDKIVSMYARGMSTPARSPGTCTTCTASTSRPIEDDRIYLDNNAVERSMRPSPYNARMRCSGAGNWAAIASLVETCKLNAINPNA